MPCKPEGGPVQKKTLLAATGVALLAAALVAVPADEAKTMSSSALALAYVHLYADANGVSHFRDERLPFPAGRAAPEVASPQLSNAQALASRPLSNAPGATLLALKRGAEEDWHRAPRRMYLIVVQGMSEVTAGDGEVRRFGPGSVLLMDDTSGKGHITRAVGSVDHIALTIPAPAE
jgi:quercetin dioxygenase-like cupin family protein